MDNILEKYMENYIYYAVYASNDAGGKMLTPLLEFSKSLESLEIFGGVRFCWHFLDSSLLLSVPGVQTEHDRTPFCKKLKDVPGMHRLCLQSHRKTAFARALRLREPFLLHCHCGCLELAVPWFPENRFAGILFAGTFADASVAGYSEFQKERSLLPVMEEPRLLALGRFLEDMMARQLAGLRFPESDPMLLPPVPTEDSRILLAAKYMRAHSSEKLTASRMAARVGLSLSRFLHLFSEEARFPFSDWLQRLRVSSALRLVEGSDVPFGTIAEVCGIIDQSRMTFLFRRYFGKTPRRMRAEARIRTMR